jgi:hypothetical protein
LHILAFLTNKSFIIKRFAFSAFHHVKKIYLLIILTFISINIFAQNQWTWMSGYLVSDIGWMNPRPLPSPLSVRGTPWTLGSVVKPSVREHSGGGIANNNEIYVYGGASLESEYSSDFWVYDISQQKWAFISDLGWQIIGGIIGQESPTAHPGGRNRMASAVDNNGNIWMFGGLYYEKNVSEIFTKSDLWMYNTKTRKFTYYDDYAGSQTKPSERYRARAWFDDANNMWMYGGAVDTPNGSFSYNDLWMFNTTSKSWIFISGNKNQAYCKNCSNGSYPAIAGTGGTQYFPRSRSDYAYWKDSFGNIWIYGGYAESHGTDEYGDLWKFNPSTKVWTLISGDDALNPPKTAINPGSRNAPYCWVGTDNKLYMTGGLRQYLYFLRDIWRVNPANGNWEAVNIDNSLINQLPVSSGLRIENSSNIPGASVNTLNHLTTGSHTYMFSGYGMGSNNLLGLTGAMWRYSLDGYNSNLLPIANADSLAFPFRDSVACNIKINDFPKTFYNNATFDIDINLAGIQKSLATTNGTFSIDSTGLVWFKPVANFVGTVSMSYTYQNSAKYVSNTAQLKITIFKCGSTVLNLTSPTNDLSNGSYQYFNDEVIKLNNKINPIGNNKVSVQVNSATSIVLLPGLSIEPNSGSKFEANINSCK